MPNFGFNSTSTPVVDHPCNTAPPSKLHCISWSQNCVLQFILFNQFSNTFWVEYCLRQPRQMKMATRLRTTYWS